MIATKSVALDYGQRLPCVDQDGSGITVTTTTLRRMATPEAEVLSQELLRQLKQHPRVSVLLVPKPKVIEGEEYIAFYWLDRQEDGAAETEIPVNDYADQPPQTAAASIIASLFVRG